MIYCDVLPFSTISGSTKNVGAFAPEGRRGDQGEVQKYFQFSSIKNSILIPLLFQSYLKLVQLRSRSIVDIWLIRHILLGCAG